MQIHLERFQTWNCPSNYNRRLKSYTQELQSLIRCLLKHLTVPVLIFDQYIICVHNFSLLFSLRLTFPHFNHEFFHL